MSQKGMKPGEPMPAPCPECLAEGKVRWTDANGDLKAKVCPRCHGSGLETTTPPPTANPRPGTYHTK
jgi:DnaJ-class molecular chaperone